jgi:hypothetical protein
MAHKQQQKNGVFCAVRADGYARNNRIYHTIAKQQLCSYYNRGTVFLRGPCLDVVSRTVSEERVGSVSEELVAAVQSL